MKTNQKKGKTMQTLENATVTSDYLRQAADQLDQLEKQRGEILSTLAGKGIAVPVASNGAGNTKAVQNAKGTRKFSAAAIAAIKRGQEKRRAKERKEKREAEKLATAQNSNATQTPPATTAAPVTAPAPATTAAPATAS
jgi:hypothetical protein